jgi:hypothetical protein
MWISSVGEVAKGRRRAIIVKPLKCAERKLAILIRTGEVCKSAQRGAEYEQRAASSVSRLDAIVAYGSC